MLAIAGGKGGCGKTTITLGLAAALAGRGFDPLVVDADCDMPDIHHRLHVDNSGGIADLADGEGVRTASVTTDSGISVITGGPRAALRPALCRVSEWQGPVLVDCAAGLDPDAVRPLRHADAALFVSTDDPQCLADTEKTRCVARRLGSAARGVVIRSTATQESGAVPTDWTVHTHLPYVAAPLENEQLRAEYRSVSEELFRRRVPLSTQGR
jgi:septum site-determining protein MinD